MKQDEEEKLQQELTEIIKEKMGDNPHLVVVAFHCGEDEKNNHVFRHFEVSNLIANMPYAVVSSLLSAVGITLQGRINRMNKLKNVAPESPKGKEFQ